MNSYRTLFAAAHLAGAKRTDAVRFGEYFHEHGAAGVSGVRATKERARRPVNPRDVDGFKAYNKGRGMTYAEVAEAVLTPAEIRKAASAVYRVADKAHDDALQDALSLPRRATTWATKGPAEVRDDIYGLLASYNSEDVARVSEAHAEATPARDQSEDRRLSFIVVAQENEEHGTVWYVARASDWKRVSAFTKIAEIATLWAMIYDTNPQLYNDLEHETKLFEQSFIDGQVALCGVDRRPIRVASRQYDTPLSAVKAQARTLGVI